MDVLSKAWMKGGWMNAELQCSFGEGVIPPARWFSSLERAGPDSENTRKRQIPSWISSQCGYLHFWFLVSFLFPNILSQPFPYHFEIPGGSLTLILIHLFLGNFSQLILSFHNRVHTLQHYSMSRATPEAAVPSRWLHLPHPCDKGVF